MSHRDQIDRSYMYIICFDYYRSFTFEPPDCCIICTVSIFRTSLYHDACLRMESEKSIHKNELLWAHELSGERLMQTRGNNNTHVGIF